MGLGGLLSPFLIPPPPLPPSLFPLVPAEKAGSERPFFASKFLCRKFFGEFLLSAGAGPLLLGTLSLEAFPSRSSLPNDVGRRRRPLPPPVFSAALLIPDGRRREEREDRATDFEFEFIAVFSPPSLPQSPPPPRCGRKRNFL